MFFLFVFGKSKNKETLKRRKNGRCLCLEILKQWWFNPKPANSILSFRNRDISVRNLYLFILVTYGGSVFQVDQSKPKSFNLKVMQKQQNVLFSYKNSNHNSFFVGPFTPKTNLISGWGLNAMLLLIVTQLFIQKEKCKLLLF